MPIDHDFIRTHETDPSGKKVGNVKYTDPDGNEVYEQKVVLSDPEDGTATGLMEVNNGAARTGSADGDHATIGTTTDAAATGDGTVIGLLKRLRTLLNGGLPAALGAGGGLKVDGSGTALPVSGTVTATDLDIRDLTSVSDSVSAVVTALPNEGQQTMANSISVAVASDQSAVPVSNGGLTALNGAISGTEVQVDVLTMPTTTVQATNLDIRDLTSTSDSVAQKAVVSAEETATWTSATANGSTVEIDCAGYSLVVAHLASDAPFVGGVASVQFEASGDGGTTWNGVDTLVLWTSEPVTEDRLENYDGGWQNSFRSDVAGLTHFRVSLPTNTISAGALDLTLRATMGKAPYAVVTGYIRSTDGGITSIGATNDAEATGNGGVIGLLKRLRTLLNGGLPAALGQGTMAQSLRVVLPSDQSAVPASQSGTWTTRLSDGTDVADVLDLTNSNPLAAAIVDGSGNQITSFGGGTQYTEGDTDASITGTAMMLEGAANALVAAPGTAADGLLVNLGANNDVTIASVPSHPVTNAGVFSVQVDGSALTALQLIDDPVVQDDAGFTPGTTKVMMAGFEADESSTDSVDEGDGGAARMTLDRKQIVTVQPHTAGGLSTFMASGSDGSSILVATKQTIKGSAGQLYGWYMYNPETAVTFVHVYNTDTVTVGTTNPQQTFAIPPLSAVNAFVPQGIAFSTAMSTAATTTAGGNTAPATGVSAVFYYV